MSRQFECQREVTLPATPEQAWQAVATAAGNSAWLFPNEIAADGRDAAAWDPPHHFAVREQSGDWFNALDFEIEAIDGSTTRLRYAHSGIFMDDWDNQYDAVQQHTDFYLHTLGQYLEHFEGKAATYIGGDPGGLQGPPASAEPDGFDRLKRALGLPTEVEAGQAVTLAPPGLEPVDAVIDYATDHFLGARTDDGLYRFFGRNAFGATVGMSIHLFVDDVDVVKVTDCWQAWLDGAFGQEPGLAVVIDPAMMVDRCRPPEARRTEETTCHPRATCGCRSITPSCSTSAGNGCRRRRARCSTWSTRAPRSSSSRWPRRRHRTWIAPSARPAPPSTTGRGRG